MEGGYVNEAIISYTNPKLQIPLMASAIYAPTTTTTSAAPAATPTSASKTASASASASASLSSPPGSSSAASAAPAGGGPFHGFVAKLRSFKFDDTKNIRKRFHFDYISKDRFLGGQLKTKNGQKYVFNGPPSGVYVSKACLVIAAFIFLVALLFSIAITYFVTRQGISPKEVGSGCINPSSAADHPIQTAGWVSVNSPPPPKVDTPSPTTSAPPTPELPPIVEPEKKVAVAPPVGDIPVPATEIEDNTTKPTDRPLKLYEGWRPLHYSLLIEPHVEVSASNGSLTIEIERDMSKVTSWEPIVLDVHNVSISNVRVIRAPLPGRTSNASDEQEVDFDSDYGDENGTFVIGLDKALSGETQLRLLLSLDFVSQLTDTLQGVYKTSYINPDTKKTEWVISTQFSPIDARRAFPCFDRPDMKANFTISIIRSTEFKMSLSNMPKAHTTRYRPGYIRDDFLTTPKMPTYLVAFIVSNMVDSQYAKLDSEMAPRVELWTRSPYVEMTHYAYKMVRKFLPYYEDYFGIKNQLPKIDLVSVPEFGFGAMENWGLITFRDSALLVPEDLELASSSYHMQFVADIVAHELAHQWFGNLVTPKRWDDLWLKEGFACYMSFKALEFSHPEFQVMDTFTVSEFSASMELDSDNTTHAISFEVRSTSDVQRIFNPISYSKSTILLRMLNSIVGEEAFRSATRDLLKKFAYGNIDRDDLWAILTQHGHEQGTLPKDLSIKQIMDSWITQPGYPVVNVERRGVDLVLRQERYLLPTKNPADQSRWFIPITFETDELHKGDNVPTHWMRSQDEEELIVSDVFTNSANNDNVIYLNLNRQGYYRVNYDLTSWLALKKNFSMLPRITRAQLLDDALHLAQAEYLTYDIPLTFLMELFTAVDDELLWSAANRGLNSLANNLKREPAYETFRAFMKFIVRPAFDRYGLNEPDNESHLQLQHRALVANLACKFNYDRCTQVAQMKFREWMRDPKKNPIKPNLKSVIYCTALAEGSFQEWYFAYKQYKTTTSASEKEEILGSLGCTTKPWLLSKYLNMTINPTSGILKQDGDRAFMAVAYNAVGHELAFDFLQSNIKEIAEYYGDGFSTVSAMIKSLTVYMNRDYHKHKLQDLAANCRKLGLRAVESTINLALEQVNNNIYWRKHSYDSLKVFLEGIVSEFQINIF